MNQETINLTNGRSDVKDRRTGLAQSACENADDLKKQYNRLMNMKSITKNRHTDRTQNGQGLKTSGQI
jgi:hypothetical protein